MNLKVLFMIIVYYSFLSLFIIFGGASFSDYDAQIELNSTNMTSAEIDESAGLFNTGVSFTRFIGLITFGVGLPETFPNAFRIFYNAWQTIVTLMTIGFVISSFWDG